MSASVIVHDSSCNHIFARGVSIHRDTVPARVTPREHGSHACHHVHAMCSLHCG